MTPERLWEQSVRHVHWLPSATPCNCAETESEKKVEMTTEQKRVLLFFQLPVFLTPNRMVRDEIKKPLQMQLCGTAPNNVFSMKGKLITSLTIIEVFQSRYKIDYVEPLPFTVAQKNKSFQL